jgi:hypothetical protein
MKDRIFEERFGACRELTPVAIDERDGFLAEFGYVLPPP